MSIVVNPSPLTTPGGVLRGRVARTGTRRVAAVAGRQRNAISRCGVGGVPPSRSIIPNARPTYVAPGGEWPADGVSIQGTTPHRRRRRDVHTEVSARVVAAVASDGDGASAKDDATETTVPKGLFLDRAAAIDESDDTQAASKHRKETTTISDGVSLDRKYELSSVLRFAIPLLATNIVTPLLTMTDTAFVGRCASDAVVQLAALGVSTPLTDYTVTLAAFIPAGLTNIISNGLAAGESDESLGTKTYGALLVSLVLSLVLAATLISCPETLLGWLKTPTEVMGVAAEFTKIRALGMPAAYLTTAAYAILVSRKDTTSPLACVCLAASVNVVLDWIAVAYFGMGASGAAWATTVALWVGCFAILNVVNDRGYAKHFPWGTLKWKEQLAPVMVFFGPITFLVFALLSIYTALILFANSLGVTVSAAHRIAGNVFAVAVLCGDPLIQAGQAFMPKYLLPSVPKRRYVVPCTTLRLHGCPYSYQKGLLRPEGTIPSAPYPDCLLIPIPHTHGRETDTFGVNRISAARKMAGLLQQVGVGAGFAAAFGCALVCLLGAGTFTTDAAVIKQVQTVVTPMCFAVLANVVSKSMYGVTVAAKQLTFLAAITGVGLGLFALALWRMNAVLVGPELYYWMWWVVAGYYVLAIVCIQVLTFGWPGGVGFKGLFFDKKEGTSQVVGGDTGEVVDVVTG